MNGDKLPDLLVANGDGNAKSDHGSVSVLLGNGKGGFTLNGNFPALTNPTSLTVGDFDGDGSVDVLTANPGNTSDADPSRRRQWNFRPAGEAHARRYAAGRGGRRLQRRRPADAAYADAGSAVRPTRSPSSPAEETAPSPPH